MSEGNGERRRRRRKEGSFCYGRKQTNIRGCKFTRSESETKDQRWRKGPLLCNYTDVVVAGSQMTRGERSGRLDIPTNFGREMGETLG